MQFSFRDSSLFHFLSLVLEEILSRICPPLVTVITNHVIIIYLSTQSFSHDFSNKAIINDYILENT